MMSYSSPHTKEAKVSDTDRQSDIQSTINSVTVVVVDVVVVFRIM